MIILHESLPWEAEVIARRCRDVYGFESRLVGRDLSEEFIPIPEFRGVWHSAPQLRRAAGEYGGKKVFILTPRDLYLGRTSKEDDWAFGYSSGNLAVMATARLKRFDSQPSQRLLVTEEKYRRRVELLAVHEVGHDLVRADHFQEATWVNSHTAYTLRLGSHCADNTCAMYEMVDIRAPPAADGFLQLGTDRRYDAGVDDALERLAPEWLCRQCRASIRLDERYKDASSLSGPTPP